MTALLALMLVLGAAPNARAEGGAAEMLSDISLLMQLTATQTGQPDLREPIGATISAVPRAAFLPGALKHQGFASHSLPIGFGRRMDSPFVAALTLQSLSIASGDRVLLAGLGSGYYAALLSRLGAEVVAVEEVPAFQAVATARLEHLGFSGIMVKRGAIDEGWNSLAPYDAVLDSRPAGEASQALLQQLRPGGRMVQVRASGDGEPWVVLVEKDSEQKSESRNLVPLEMALDSAPDPI